VSWCLTVGEYFCLADGDSPDRREKSVVAVASAEVTLRFLGGTSRFLAGVNTVVIARTPTMGALGLRLRRSAPIAGAAH